MSGLFWLGFVIHLIGSMMDILSSLSFEKVRSSTTSIREGNTAFGGIWINKKTGGFNEKLAIGAMALVAVLMLVLHFALPRDYGAAIGIFGLIIGLVRGAFALQNWSVKAKVKEQAARERVAALKEAQRLADAQAVRDSLVNNQAAEQQEPRGFKGGSGGEW